MEKRQIEFNQDHCEVYFGRSNVSRVYTASGGILWSDDILSDLGVKPNSMLKVARQVARVVKKTCGILAFVSLVIEYKS